MYKWECRSSELRRLSEAAASRNASGTGVCFARSPTPSPSLTVSLIDDFTITYICVGEAKHDAIFSIYLSACFMMPTGYVLRQCNEIHASYGALSLRR
jgi:hypothetical protein